MRDGQGDFDKFKTMVTAAQADCFSNVPQDFLICSTVHKARQLGVFTGDTYVRVLLGKMHKSTKGFSNSENPFFNEYFVFELKCTLGELLRLTILYEVRKRTPCKKDVILGELLIDLQSVWSQPNRCFFKKWGRLEGPIGSTLTEQIKGYIQIDLAIVSQATNIGQLHAHASAAGSADAGGRHSAESAVDGGAAEAGENDGNTENVQQWRQSMDFDDIDKNLLQDIDASANCNIRYSISFYKAILAKKGDYLIQGKTSVVKGTQQPTWNHEISFAWNYPSLAQTFVVQLLMHEHLSWKCVAELELHFEEIAFKDKPVFGPTFLHLYDPMHPTQYIGRLMLEVKSECLAAEVPRQLTARPVAPVDLQRWWQSETFLVEFVALQGDFVHGNVSNMKVSLKFAENVSNYVECYLKNYIAKLKTSKGLKYFKQLAPYKAVYLRIELPDNRHKFDSDIFMHEIVEYMKTEIETFRMFQLKYNNELTMQAKCLKAVILNISYKVKKGVESNRLEYSGFKDPTAWDTNRYAYLQEFFSKLPDELRAMRQTLKSTTSKYIETTIEEVLQDLITCTQDLNEVLISARLQDEWPDLLIMLSVGSNKDLAVCRLNAKYFLQPPKDKEQTNTALCWRVRNFVFKDIQCSHSCINCGCTIAILQGCLGILVESERNETLKTIAPDWKQPEPFYWNPAIAFSAYKCRLFIHQAKVRPGRDRSGLCDAYVRVYFGSQSIETPVEHGTLSPIWNLVVCFEFVSMPGSIQWYEMNPPLVAVELLDSDKHATDDFLGSGTLTASVMSADALELQHDKPEGFLIRGMHELGRIVKTRLALQKFQQLKSLSPPPLKWVPMSLSGAVCAEVLMSAEMVEIQGDTQDVAIEPTITNGIPNTIRPTMRNYVLEVVFAGFRNYSKGGRHRVKVMMGDLLLSSGLSSSRIKQSVNFLVLYASGVVSLPEQLEYWPAIIATDTVVSTRGAETTVGAVLISNSKRFLKKEKTIKCVPAIPQADYESSIGSTTVHMEDDNEMSPLIAKEDTGNKLLKPFTFLLGLMKWGGNKGKNVAHVVFHENKIDDSDFNWWTKFYNSMYQESLEGTLKHRLVIYSRELEKHAEFSYMHDWAEPVQLVHGIKFKKNAMPKEEAYGTLKLKVKLTPCQCNDGEGDGAMLRPLAAALNPKYQAQLQSLAELCKIVVRVYIVQGLQFRPHDKNSQSDSYVKLQFGSKVACNRAHYIPNQSNPVYGKVFQLEGVLPREHVLEISVFDRNYCRDEIIGSTYIDLEDRWHSKHRATVGIPNEFSRVGYNKWRDISSPYETLLDLCKRYDIKMPIFMGDTIEIDGEIFTDETEIEKAEDLQERLSLTVLNNFEKLPSFGYKLVPEHVETRALYRSDYPGIEQGKLQLWIELYEGSLNIPPAIDITPQPPQLFELRVTIYDCTDVVLHEKNVFGSRMSDIYVKGWCHDANMSQSTDIHYRSLDGNANFNWRMVFPMKYSAIEDMMVVNRRDGHYGEIQETKQPPVLVLQLWDNDVISSDDFLGTLEVNLSSFPEPFAEASDCNIGENDHHIFHVPFTHRSKESRTLLNLFRKRKVRGWFPMRGPMLHEKSGSNGNLLPTTVLTGKIDCEIEICTETEAMANPCGLGRDPPLALAEPNRPDTSFNPLMHPMKSLKKIIFPAIKKFLKYVLIISLVVLLIVGIFSEIPSKLMTAFVP